MALPQPFGIIPTGRPVIVTPTTVPSETSFIYTLPPTRFAHITVFLLPGTILPLNTGAGVWMSYPSAPTNFKFLGAIGAGKESAVFKVRENSGSDAQEIIIGINIDSAEAIAAQMNTLSQSQTQTVNPSASSALTVAARAAATQPTTTLLLAQRIIKNAFNFLASFSGNVPVPGSQGVAGVEVVPLKAFEDWWRKFENKVKNDPSFLERDVD